MRSPIPRYVATYRFLAGWWGVDQLHAIPHRLIWDNEAGIGRRNKLADGVSAFCGALATKIVQLKPFDPESKETPFVDAGDSAFRIHELDNELCEDFRGIDDGHRDRVATKA